MSESGDAPVFVAEYYISFAEQLAEYNQNHDASGKFGTGSALGAEYQSHVTGSGPYDSQHDHTVSVELNDEIHQFTDGWNKDDIVHILTSDYAYQFHGSDGTMEGIANEFSDHPDSMMIYSDAGKMTMFTNNALSREQINDATNFLGATIDEHERQNGQIGTYELTDQYESSSSAQQVQEYNQNHDASGKFGSGSGASSFDGKSDNEKEGYLVAHGGAEWEYSLTPEEMVSVYKYTSVPNYYKEMNGALRFGKSVSPEMAQEIQHAANALHRGHAPTDMTVHRDINNEMFSAFEANVGKHFVDRGFTSTTLTDNLSHASVHMIIKIPQGAPGAYVSRISRFTNEKEWLFPPSSKMKILQAYTDSSGRKVINLEYVGQHQVERARTLAMMKEADMAQGNRFTWEPGEIVFLDDEQNPPREQATADSLKEQWRQPEQKQIDLEQQLTALLTAFLTSVTITADHSPYFSSEVASNEKLVTEIANLLQQAHDAGTGYGQKMVAIQAQEGLISTAKGMYQRAKDMVTSIINRLRTVLSDAVDKAKQDGTDVAESVQEAADTLIQNLPDVVAGTEIHTEIEIAVADVLAQAGVQQVVWVTNPGACEQCLANEAQGAINLGSAFVGKVTQPPQHPQCQCNLHPVKEK